MSEYENVSNLNIIYHASASDNYLKCNDTHNKNI